MWLPFDVGIATEDLDPAEVEDVVRIPLGLLLAVFRT
jgi:hypothetical protein